MIKKLTSRAAKQEEFNERTAGLCVCIVFCNPDIFDRFEIRITPMFGLS